MAAMEQTQFSLRPKILLILLVPLALVFLPTTAVLTVGMIPTLVAFVVDGSRRRYLTVTVGGLNLVGSLYFLHQLWTLGQGLGDIRIVLGNSYGWLASLSGAACGWMLFLGMPFIIRHIAAAEARIRLYTLRREQEKLVQDWGQQVTGASDEVPAET
ncbi:hypothetical protein ACFPL7_10395 [Dongia soli]|uniref:Uncharacterized protein n=1 Tax=Dongia soli TaxID=600628 RepID=A0ABU5EC50_9PROT|nr:hypothetical protein [Dongia soli]MDY0883359.1 hypothetical protein [Dongia soli]